MEIHVFNKSQIMARAWVIARQRRADVARRAYDASMGVVAGRIVYVSAITTALIYGYRRRPRANGDDALSACAIDARPAEYRRGDRRWEGQ
jgi:hypothetical protein